MQMVASSGAAVSLQNAEGQHLLFLRLHIDAALVGPFAYVQNEMVFQNPQNRRMEGRFSFTLPTTAAGTAMPSRFAMEINGKLMEGEVVDRSKAQRVYREILHEARDPALLEQGQGNVFSARVFPIEANAMVRLILSYAVTVPMKSFHRELILPLSGLPVVHDFSFTAMIGSLGGEGFNADCSLGGITTTKETNQVAATVLFNHSRQMWIPNADAVVQVRQSGGRNVAMSVNGGGLVSLFTIGSGSAPGTTTTTTIAQARAVDQAAFMPPAWTVYIDTSASTADTVLVRMPLIAALLDAMPPSMVEVFAFDIEVVELVPRAVKTANLGSTVQNLLEERLALGATDLELLLKHVDTHVTESSAAAGVLILTDAIPTVSEQAAMQLQKLLTVRPNRVVELGVIGTKFDSTVGSSIAAAGNGRIVRIPLTSQNLPGVAGSAWQDFTRPLGQRGLPVVGNSGWIWPEAAFDLHVGDEVVVFSGGDMLGAPQLQLTSSTLEAEGTPVVAPAANGALLAREVVRARLELLEAKRQLAANASAAASMKNDIVKLSEENRIMCSHTALLVLETNEDYKRFGINQQTLKPILVVEADGVRLRQREDIVLSDLPLPMKASTTTIGKTTTTSASTAMPKTGEAPNDPEPQEMSKASDTDERTASSLGQELSSSSVSGVRRCSPTMLLVLLICFLWNVVGVESTSSTWENLEASATKVLSDHGPSGPQERRRDVATQYAAALWTKKKSVELRAFCVKWMSWDPINGLAYEYFSKAAQHLGQGQTSLRAATSIAEIAPRDAEQLLRGAWHALSLNLPTSGAWAKRFAERSLAERQDNPNTYRALALASWQDGDTSAAVQAFQQALKVNFNGRYGDVQRVLNEEASMMCKSMVQQQSMAQEDLKSCSSRELATDVSLHISLSWLTDANDVDLHVVDPNGEECYYGHKSTAAGLELYSDQTQGLGPEVMVLHGAKAGTYKIGVKYFSSGAMGASRGTVVVRRVSEGVQVGQAQIEVFTLPSGYSNVMPITTVAMQ